MKTLILFDVRSTGKQMINRNIANRLAPATPEQKTKESCVSFA